MDSFRE